LETTAFFGVLAAVSFGGDLGANVHIIILNWNGFADTAVCLSSLRQLHYDHYKVTVVDNGSTDDSVSRLRNEFSWITLIETGKNLGFAAGCNVGIRHALAEGANFVWLLNNDTKVDPTALQALIETANTDPLIGAVGSAIYCMDRPERIQAWGGGYVSFWRGRSRHFQTPVSDQRVEFITGASLLISRQALESVGLLDEKFFMYWEDADFCFRLRRANWRIAVARGSKIWHKQSASVGEKSARLDAYFNASAARFFSRHAPVSWFSLWVGALGSIAKRMFRGDWKRSRAIWNGAKTGKNDGHPTSYQAANFGTDKSRS
jgi:GT2 family glycosyltransferase